jgi:PIN domain nuclease of toxin-antitoxin system
VKALLDTHVLLWWLGPASRLSPAQWEVIESAGPEEPLWVSEISFLALRKMRSMVVT